MEGKRIIVVIFDLIVACSYGFGGHFPTSYSVDQLELLI